MDAMIRHASRNDRSAVGRKDDVSFVIQEAGESLTAGHVPQARCRSPPHRCQELAIRRTSDAVDRHRALIFSAEMVVPQFLARLCVPYTNPLVRSTRRKKLSIRGVGSATDPCSMP